jgi:serine/threonine protein kinase
MLTQKKLSKKLQIFCECFSFFAKNTVQYRKKLTVLSLFHPASIIFGFSKNRNVVMTPIKGSRHTTTQDLLKGQVQVKGMSTVATARLLYKCDFLPENDFDYLKDSEKWIRKLMFRLSPEEMKSIVAQSIQDKLMYQLENEPSKIDIIIEKVFSRGAEHTYLSGKQKFSFVTACLNIFSSEIKLPELDFNQRKEIEACYVATILRHLILRDGEKETTKDREEFKTRIFGKYSEFLENEYGNDSELTWLFRFERAILIAKNYVNGNRNKGLFLAMANLLEGSDEFTKYVTGGHSSKETKRRVLLIESICDIKPRKRARKLAADAPLQQKKENRNGNNDFEGEMEASDGLLQLAVKPPVISLSFPVTLPQFTPERLIEENAVYRLYDAKQSKTYFEVTLKIFTISGHDETFSQEVEILKLLNQTQRSESICRMVDAAASLPGQERFIAFEHIGDLTLLSLVKCEEEMVIVNVMKEVLETLLFIHDSGVIMRNLRLESVFLVDNSMNSSSGSSAANLRIKFGDFTHAVMHVESKQTTSSSSSSLPEGDQDVEDLLLQSSFCLAPELLSEFDSEVDYSVDIWSFGMMFFLLGTGYFPIHEILTIQENIDNEDPENNKSILCKLIRHSEWSSSYNKSKFFVSEILKIHASERKSGKEIQKIMEKNWPTANDSRKNSSTIQSTQFIQSTMSFKQSMCMQMAISRFKTLKDSEILKDSKGKLKDDSKGNKAQKLLRKAIFTIMAANRFQKGLKTPDPVTPAEVANTLTSEDKLVSKGRYTLITSLMTGNDFNIYAGILSSTNGKVFVKRIRVKNQQYDTELTILRLLNNHSFISQFVDCIEENIERYLIIERLDDGCLIDLLNMNGQTPVTHLNENRIKSIAQGLVKAVDFMHSKRVIHRGLSLANITIKVLNENEITCKIWNFHTATSADRCHEKPLPTTFLSATDAYCVAPELLSIFTSSPLAEKPIERSYYDAKVDLWSVGVILYCLVEKKSPWAIGSPLTVFQSILRHFFPSSSSSSVPVEPLIWSNESFSKTGKETIEGLLRYHMEERVNPATFKAMSDWIGISFHSSFTPSPVVALHQPAGVGNSYSAQLPSNLVPIPKGISEYPYHQLPHYMTAASFPPHLPAFLSVGGGVEEAKDEEAIKGTQYDVQLKYYQEKVLERKTYYLKYFEFLKAMEVDEERADKLHDELMEIDPKGEEKLDFPTAEQYKTAASQASDHLLEMIGFYKSVTKDKVSAYTKVKELRDVKSKLDEIVNFLL